MKLIFIDLEKTLISSWDGFISYTHPGLINERVIRRYLKTLKCSEIGIFSHAIYDNNDLKVFQRDMCRLIEKLLNVKVQWITTVESLRKQHQLEHITDAAYCRMYSKTDSFLQFVKNNHPIYIPVDATEVLEYILIDDEVQNSLSIGKDYRIEFININTLIEGIK